MSQLSARGDRAVRESRSVGRRERNRSTNSLRVANDVEEVTKVQSTDRVGDDEVPLHARGSEKQVGDHLPGLDDDEDDGGEKREGEGRLQFLQ